MTDAPELFARGENVWLRFAMAKPRRAVVLSDAGADHVVIARFNDPAKTERVARYGLSREPDFEVPPLMVVTTDHGDCAMQRQANPLTAKDMAQGQFTVCGTWVQTRTKPPTEKPTCPRCIEYLTPKE